MQISDAFRRAIRAEIESRRRLNPRYSTRAFALSINVDPGNLSRILNSAAGASVATATKLANALNIDSLTRQQYLGIKTDSRFDLCREKNEIQEVELKPESFRIISDLYHSAILELTYIPGFRADPIWLAKKLSISKLEAKLAFERLVRLGLLEKSNGTWRKTTNEILRTAPGRTSKIRQKYQRAVLRNGEKAVTNVPYSQRANSSMAFPMAGKNIPAARQLIEKFVAQACKTFSRGECDTVYQLGVCLFPLSKSTKD